MKNIWNWLITSSEDPERTSLAVRGALTMGASYLLSVAPLACSIVTALCFDTGSIAPIIDSLVKIVDGLLLVFGGAAFLIGIIRKISLGRWSHPAA